MDYDTLEERALDFRPKLLICGGSAYPRDWDYKRLRDIANKVRVEGETIQKCAACTPFMYATGRRVPDD